MESGVSVLKGGWHNPTLVDFPGKALRPIWSRCTKDDRRKAFATEFEKRAAARHVDVSGLARYTPVYLYQNRDVDLSYRLHCGASIPKSRIRKILSDTSML